MAAVPESAARFIRKQSAADSAGREQNSIAEITADTLYQCHRAFYHPGNMVLCVVGDVDPEQVAAIAQDVLPQERRDRAEKDLEHRSRMLRQSGRSPK